VNSSTIVTVALISFLAGGCHSGHSLIGKWTMTAGGHTQNFLFESDSTVVATSEIRQPPMTTTVTGKHALANDLLSITFTDLSVKTADASKQAALDAFIDKNKKTALERINKSAPSSKIVWKSNDELTMTDSSGKGQSLTRVKS
jgi:hypothetical protein